ncbi:MAG: glutaredoxin family protein [Candidatus Tectomicrobia bacterium]|nr:glutaredoxin family protein [Candidatus Tectomicrobia bacterium]
MKEFLSRHGIPFRERVVDQDAEALWELQARTGMRATPVIIMGEKVVVGFDRGRLEALLGLGK